MCPGPNDIADRVLRAMIRPATAPGSPEFQEVFEQVHERLAQVFQTSNQVITVPGSGRTGLESAILSVLEPGDPTLTITAGYFGSMAIRIITNAGGKADEISFPWGEPLDLERIEEKIAQGGYKLVTMVHNETSSGALYQEAGAVARMAHQHGALFLLDAISSLGGAPLPTDEWEVDLCVSCSHKAMASPIGHGYVAVSDRAWSVMEQRKEPCRSTFFNLLNWKAQPSEEAVGGRTHRRPQVVFSSVHVYYALHEALQMILEEGVEQRWNRHRINAQAFREGIQALGLKPLAKPEIASPTVTCIPLPEGIRPADFLQKLRAEHGIYTTRGLGPYRENAIRIGHMGVTAIPRCILHTLYAMESVLASFGYPVSPGAAVSRAGQVYAEAQQHQPEIGAVP
ncbi:MAG: alanine--glyoxylate aminotransferase family protein [Nitrospinota bacterium]|nr:MAG: alanine--glyoxylate aminotransferase family protein [Nitrospinota bacterium]